MRITVGSTLKAALVYGLLVSSAAIPPLLERHGSTDRGIADREDKSIFGRAPPIGLPKVPVVPSRPGGGSGGRPGDEGDTPDPSPGSGAGQTDDPATGPRPGTGAGGDADAPVPAPGTNDGASSAAPANEIAKAKNRGARTLESLENSISNNKAPPANTYGDLIKEYNVPEPQSMKFSLQVGTDARNFFKENGMDLGKVNFLGSATGPNVKKVVIYGDTDPNKIPGKLPAVEAYVNSDDGWMWFSRRYRSGKDADALYPGIQDLNKRIQMSEHVHKTWTMTGNGGKPPKAIVSPNIDNDDMLQVLSNVKQATPGNPDTLEITPAGNPQAWNAINGGSAGGSLTRALSDYHDDFGNVVPVRATAYHPKDESSYIILHYGPLN